MSKGITWCQKASDVLRRSNGCPLILRGAVTKMTRQGFARACLHRQKGNGKDWYADGKVSLSLNNCKRCKRGEAIADGRRWTKPDGVEFLTIKQLMAR
ncbi:MAG: hypothetical protein KJO32_13730 [Deltaproteobacteria bacterium]|nr:hypothetical protein [Deltaproteobacteria bacterium]